MTDSLLFYALSFILALGVLITVHEFGHFWVARKLGIKVLRFSVGFGKPLWRRLGKVDGTEFVIAGIPLGGYVKMLDEREGAVADSERHRAFNRQSLMVRSAVVVAGPLFNFLFAICAYWLIFVTGDTGLKPLVGEVAPESIAARAGFEPGDQIIAIADKETPTWESSVYALLAASVEQKDLMVRVVDREQREHRRWLASEELVGMGEEGAVLEYIGLTPERPRLPAVIGELVSGEAADRAGLLPGDEIVTSDGEAVQNWDAWVRQIRAHPDQRIWLEVRRGDEMFRLPLTIGHRMQKDGSKIGRIGAGVHVPEGLQERYQAEIRLGPAEAVSAAVAKTWDLSVLMLKMLGKMLVGELSVKNLSGPLSIAESAGKSASYGVVYFLKFLAVVSISLGVLNLLPIPMLDGGHLIYFLIEGVKGSPLSESAQMAGQRIGLLILLALMSLAFYVDISRLLG